MKLLMISGDRSLAQGKKGAFYNTLEEFHKYWERIDIICPKSDGVARLGAPHDAHPPAGGEHHGGEEGQDPVFDDVFIHPSPWPLIFQPVWILKKGLEIHKEQKFKAMTVHEYPPFYNGFGARLLWNKIKVPYILEIFHIPGYPKSENLKEKVYRYLFYAFIKYDCQKAKAVRVMNEQVAEKLADLGVPTSKIKLIPAIYVDLDIFRPMGLEKKYDLIFVGRLAKNKGVSLLIDAASKFKIQNPNFKLLVVGDGPMKKSLKFKVKNLKLEDNIVFYGWAQDQERVAKLLNQSKILVMTSYNEGGPRVIVEAIACGVPFLATNVGIVADIIKDGQCGRIIKWNKNDIAQKSDSLLNNYPEYQKLSRNGLGLVPSFEKKSAIKNYAEKIKELSTV